MTRLVPAAPDDLPESMRAVLEYAEKTMGFTPNDVLIMARWPELLQAMAGLVGTVFVPGRVDMELKRLVALMTSRAAGCQYCVAHNAYGLQLDGTAPEKQAAIWEFETSPLFTAAERAALRYALGAGQTPAGVTDADFAELHRHFDDQQILELAGVIGLFGFLNRWNASLATPLEAVPLAHAQAALAGTDWGPGQHLGDTSAD
jgi:uncharacterized peroxidase-related enzyme